MAVSEILSGKSLIGSEAVAGNGVAFYGVNPATGEQLSTAYGNATAAEVERACALAAAAFDTFRSAPLEQRAAFLESIAAKLAELGDKLVESAMQETGLTRPRLQGELGRTVGQLRLFATVVREGDWQGVRIDPAMPERQPIPKPDLRLRYIPLGPVAVFGASNFPLAFSVAGGDTASALAAGCPVVVKAHPAHPGTSELAGRAIQAAVAEAGLPEGVFSLLFGTGNELGTRLVQNPHIKAVGFTGSRGGGLALVELAAKRPEPIPVYAEMSSINPVILFPAALNARAAELGKAFVGSVTLGAGQFCTNPGLVLAAGGDGLDTFIASATEAMAAAAGAPMLHAGILKAYEQGVARASALPEVTAVARGAATSGPTECQATLFKTKAPAFLAEPAMSAEIFGASSLIVACDGIQEMHDVLKHLEGQLTITLQMDAADEEAAAGLLPLLETKAGRILVNGWPTGVEVSRAMVHGGPYPSTSNSATTSVGTLAIQRFLRPVCYQNFPKELLPVALRDETRFAPGP